MMENEVDEVRCDGGARKGRKRKREREVRAVGTRLVLRNDRGECEWVAGSERDVGGEVVVPERPRKGHEGEVGSRFSRDCKGRDGRLARLQDKEPEPP